MRASLPVVLAAYGLALSPSCGGDKATDSGDASSQTGITESTGDAETSVDEGLDEGSADTAAVAGPAVGITITEVEANQGTRVPIGADGSWVDGPGRNARLVSNRDTLVRIHFVVDEGWIPREVEGVLHVYDASGNELNTHSQTISIEGNSDPRFIDSTFFFGLVADEGETANGTQYWVELLEADPSASALPAGVNTTPSDGPNFVGFEAQDMSLAVMYVPIAYAANGITPDVASRQNDLDDFLLQLNPVSRIESTVHDPVPYNQTLTNLGSLLGLMEQLRSQEGAPGNVYYSALVDTGQQSGVVGIATLGGLVNANLWRNSFNGTVETLLHEIGHNQALAHVYCPGADAANPDPTYPYADGIIGNRGFGIRNFTLYSEDGNVDYMSYCSPVWISDWTWEKAWTRIAQFSAQGFETQQVPVLRNAIYPDGTEQWWTANVPYDQDQMLERITGEHRLEFVDSQGVELASEWATVETLSDDSTRWISVRLPEDLDFAAVASVRRRSNGRVSSVAAVSSLTIAHGLALGPQEP